MADGAQESLQFVIEFILDEAKSALQGLKSDLQKVKDVAKEAAIGMAAIGAALGAATNVFAEFEAVLNQTQSVGELTAAQMEEIRVTALKMGADTQFSAKQAAEGFLELAKAGFTFQESMDSMPGVLALAAAGQLKIGEAAEITAGILRAFNLDASAAVDVADQLAQAANTSAVDVTDLQQSMKFVAPVAAAAGQSIEEMSGILALLGNNGIKSGQAGTIMRASILSLAKPTKDSAEIMNKLGISIEDAKGNMLPFSAIVEQFRVKMQGMSQVQQQAALATIFGQEAVSGMMVMVNQASGVIDEYIGKQRAATGAAQAMADGVNRGIKYQLEQLAGTIETLAILIGEDLAPAVGAITEAITGFVNMLTEMPAGVRQAGVVVLAFTGTLLGLAAALGGLVALAPTVSTAWGLILGPWGAAALAVAGVATALAVYMGAQQKANAEASQAVGKTQAQIESLNKLANRYADLEAKAKRSKAEEAERLEILKKLEQISPDLISAYDAEGKAIGVNRDRVRELNDELREELRLIQEKQRARRGEVAGKLAEAEKALAEAANAVNLLTRNRDLTRNAQSTVSDNSNPVILAAEKALQEAQARLNTARQAREALAQELEAIDNLISPKGKTAQGGGGTGTPKAGKIVQAQGDDDSALKALGPIQKILADMRRQMDAATTTQAKMNALTAAEGKLRTEIATLQKNKQGNTKRAAEAEEALRDVLKQQKDLAKADHDARLKAARDTYNLAMERAKAEEDKGKRAQQELNATSTLLDKLKAEKAEQLEIEQVTNRRAALIREVATIPADKRVKDAKEALEDAKAAAEGLADESLRTVAAYDTYLETLRQILETSNLEAETRARIKDAIAGAEREQAKIKRNLNAEGFEKFADAVGKLGNAARNAAEAIGVELDEGLMNVISRGGALVEALSQASSAVVTMMANAHAVVPALEAMGAAAWKSLGPYGMLAGAIVAVGLALSALANQQKQQEEAARKAHEEAIDRNIKRLQDEVDLGRKSAQEQIDFYRQIAISAYASAEQRMDAAKKVYQLEISLAEQRNAKIDSMQSALATYAQEQFSYAQALANLKQRAEEQEIARNKQLLRLDEQRRDVNKSADEQIAAIRAEGTAQRRKTAAQERIDRIAEVEKEREKRLSAIKDQEDEIALLAAQQAENHAAELARIEDAHKHRMNAINAELAAIAKKLGLEEKILETMKQQAATAARGAITTEGASAGGAAAIGAGGAATVKQDPQAEANRTKAWDEILKRIEGQTRYIESVWSGTEAAYSGQQLLKIIGELDAAGAPKSYKDQAQIYLQRARASSSRKVFNFSGQAGFASGGLIPDDVRFDGMPATLHKGEMILPRDITQGLLQAIRGGSMGGNLIQVTVTGNNFHPDMDERAFANRISRRIADGLRGGGLI